MRLRALFAAIFCVLSVTAAHAASSADPMGWTGIMYHHSSSSLEDGHGDGYTSYTGAITLTGAVVSGADRITVTWEAEGSEYALSKFRKWDATYTYNISPKLGNIREGDNTYIVRQYVGTKVVDKWFARIRFLDPSKRGEFMAKAISEDIGAFGAYKFVDRYEAPFYNTKWVSADEKRGDDLVATTSFALGEKFGTYTLPLPDASWLEYEVSLVTRPSGEQVQSARFAIGRPGPEGSEKLSNFVGGVDFSLGQFNNPSVESYSGGYIIVHTGGGHEGIDQKFLFDPVRMTLSDIYADLEKRTIGYRAYPIFTSVIVGGQLVLEEHRYCCDMVYDPNGHERLVYDLATMKLVSRKPLETPVPPTAKLLRKSGKSVTFATGGYVESEDFGQSVHPVGDDSKDESYRVLNTSFLTKFYRSYKPGYEPMTFKSVSGTAYTDTEGRQYIIIESIVPEV